MACPRFKPFCNGEEKDDSAGFQIIIHSKCPHHCQKRNLTVLDNLQHPIEMMKGGKEKNEATHS